MATLKNVRAVKQEENAVDEPEPKTAVDVPKKPDKSESKTSDSMANMKQTSFLKEEPDKKRDVDLVEHLNETIQLSEAQLEGAAYTIINALHDATKKYMENFCLNRNLPMWQLICGVLNKAYQEGSINAPLLDPGWKSRNPVKITETICINCEKKFRPKRRGQLFCSTECGAKGRDKAIKLGIIK